MFKSGIKHGSKRPLSLTESNSKYPYLNEEFKKIFRKYLFWLFSNGLTSSKILIKCCFSNFTLAALSMCETTVGWFCNTDFKYCSKKLNKMPIKIKIVRK